MCEHGIEEWAFYDEAVRAQDREIKLEVVTDLTGARLKDWEELSPEVWPVGGGDG